MQKKYTKKLGSFLMAATMAFNAVSATSFVNAADAQKYEFEDAALTGTVEAVLELGASGSKVAYMTEDGTITVDVEAPSTGMYKLTIYAYGVGSGKIQNLAVNGVDQAQISISEGEIAPVALSVMLNEGTNQITISKSWGWTKFDYMTVEADRKSVV